MTFNSIRKRALGAGSALNVLVLLGGGVAAIGLPTVASAQDYTSAAIGGSVSDSAGNSVQGATVTLTSIDTGNVRTATTSNTGGYRFAGLQPGNYNLTVEAGGLSTYTAEGINVLASQAANVPVVLTAGGDAIVVTGARAVQAFTGTTTGLNVDVADFIKDRPLGRDLQSIIQLSPGSAPGNSGSNTAFNGLSSLGGASVAENAYYINGLNITNFDNYLGSVTVPFYFYKSVDIKTGGYPAEYGRATGGIVNAVTKSGSNDFEAAVHIDWAPNFLRSKAKDVFTVNGDTGELIQTTNRRFDRADSLLTAIEASGPIIPDKLFVYGLLQLQDTSSIANSPNAGFAFRRENNDPFWGVKVDAYPIDSQHLEFTIFNSRNTETRFDLDYSEGANGPVYGGASSVTDFPAGGVNYVAKYTGTFTEWLTVSAAYGRVRDRFDQISVAGETDTPFVQNASGRTVFGVNNGGLFTGQSLSSIDQPYTTEREFYRADVDLFFSLLGEHHIRAGYDQENNSLNHVTVRTGGQRLLDEGLITQAAYDAVLGNAGYVAILRAPDTTRPGSQILELNYFNTGGTFDAKNQAYYIEDEWRVFDDLTLNLGVRRDDFRINKPSGLPLADLKENYAPRVGFSYNVGDSGKLFGSYGWYFLPIASNTAFRQGAPSFFFRQRYYISGFDNDGLPLANELVAANLVTNNSSYQTACPLALVPGAPTTNCSVTGDGADIDLGQGIAANLKATKESEFIIGYEQKLGMWTLGLSYTRRQLDRIAEDSAVDAAVIAYCNENGIVPVNTTTGVASSCETIWSGFHQYVINNPGNDIIVNLLAAGFDIDNQTVTLNAEDLGYGDPKRTYDAVTFSFDRAYDGKFSVGGSYTWSKSLGNSEGFVQSDFGQDDAGITQDFDQPGFIPGAYGYLPNDRRHKIKLYGSYSFTDQFAIGTNFQLLSPSPLSCLGFNPTDAFANVYGAASHYCNGQLSPRGTAQESDWFEQVDLSFRFNTAVAGRGLTLRADVFNLFNSQAVLSRNQVGELDPIYNDDTGLPETYIANPSYGQPNIYQSRRYVRLGADITF